MGYYVPVSLIFDHAQQPHGGHYFPDPSGFTLRAPTLRGLLEAIVAYRRANGMSPGSPEAEVEAFYRTQFPWLVSKVGAPPEATEDPIARWLNRMWRNPPKEKEFVESEVERSRLATCSVCPHYAAAHPFSTDARRRLIILGAGRISDEGACRIHHWACGLAVLIAAPEAKEVEGCWAQAFPVSTSIRPNGH